MLGLTQTFDAMAAFIVGIVAVCALAPSPRWHNPTTAVSTAVVVAAALYLCVRALPLWGFAA